MEKKNEKAKVLNLEQMEMVSGGNEAQMNKVYICSVCGETFDSFSNLSLHAVKEHPYDKKPQR